jgi:GTP-binding protein
VYFLADENINTLMTLRYKNTWKADKGQPGQSKDKYGSHGEDLIIPVPPGTILKDAEDGHVIAHLQHHGDRCLVAKGGRGGAGNIHFKNAQNQFPNIALLGEPSQQRDILVELQLLGDVALIGTPSTGKSSLINAITHVKAKTADYEFTTLIPNLGIVDHKGINFSMIDIPGLIAGASEGK